MDYVALKAWLEEQIKRYEAEGKVSKVLACDLLLQELEAEIDQRAQVVVEVEPC